MTSTDQMNAARLQQLIDSYGANPEAWPVADRPDAELLLAAQSESTELIRNNLEEATRLDQMLNSYSISPDTAESSEYVDAIMSRINTTSFIDKCLDWLTPDVDALLSTLWRPALAASMPLIAGILVGSLVTQDILQNDAITLEEELLLLAITEDSVQEWVYE